MGASSNALDFFMPTKARGVRNSSPADTSVLTLCYCQRDNIDIVDSGRPRDNAGMQNAESFNFELDDIAGFEPAPDMFCTKLEDTAEADRATTDDVAREKIGIARRVCDHSWKCMMKKRAVAARQLAAINACVHLQRNRFATDLIGKFIAGNQRGPHAGGKVLPLGRTKSDRHLRPLQIARGKIVDDGETGYAVPRLRRRDIAAALTNDNAELKFVIKLGAAGGREHAVVVADERVRIGEVEHRNLVPGRIHLFVALRARRADVLPEGVKIAKSRWAKNRREKSARAQRLAAIFLEKAAVLRPVADFARQLSEPWHEHGKKLLERRVWIFQKFVRAEKSQKRMKRHPEFGVDGNGRNRLVSAFGKDGGEAHFLNSR